jgi:predicted NAD-dependent protein-ADP-ribosyltransferase YbiA (DUF1768 family)
MPQISAQIWTLLFLYTVSCLSYSINRDCISRAQESICEKYPKLRVLIGRLPGCVPARLVADALGYEQGGLDRACASLEGESYVWATEFENVHSFWTFEEPRLTVEGKSFSCSEELYQAQKPKPRNQALWCDQKEGIMRKAVRAKFAASAEARAVLNASYPHPLVSIKGDTVWGFHPEFGGRNLLAKLLTCRA